MQFTAVAKAMCFKQFYVFHLLSISLALDDQPRHFITLPLQCTHTNTHTQQARKPKYGILFILCDCGNKRVTTNAIEIIDNVSSCCCCFSFNYKGTNNIRSTCRQRITEKSDTSNINFTQNTNFIFILRLRYDEKIVFV